MVSLPLSVYVCVCVCVCAWIHAREGCDFILTYIYIYSLVLCFIVLFLFILHCSLSGPVLTYISLLVIPCMIVYVTNNKEP